MAEALQANVYGRRCTRGLRKMAAIYFKHTLASQVCQCLILYFKKKARNNTIVVKVTEKNQFSSA